MNRFLKWSLIGTPLMLSVLAVGITVSLRGTLPQTSGTIVVERGLKAPVEIVRDPVGIPNIFAGSSEDAYFALGYVHAQDRFWQMEMMRRLGAGRLSEVVGRAGLRSDRWMRTLGLHRLAEKAYRDLPDPVRDALDSYAAGVNSWLSARTDLVAPEFALVRFRPEPWTPSDSLVWGKIMATRLAGNWRDEVFRAQLAERLPPERIAELWPDYPADAPVTLSATNGTGSVWEGLTALSPWPQGPPMGASNVWALAPSATATGGPILANDPHLGFGAPIVWYLARIEAPGLSVTGATVPGVPFTILGHNERIAWGVASTQSDLEDLFIEELEDGHTDRYVTPDGSRPFYRRKEVINIRGESDIELEVRSTEHGPVISDLRPELAGMTGERYVVALAATYMQPNDLTARSLFDLNRANGWRAFSEALRYFQGPQQNFVYADVAGNIGFIAPGLVPLRRGGRGLVPGPGWTGATDWQGFVAFERLPRAFNPESGRIVNANNRIVSEGYPHFITHDWESRYRAERILELLDSRNAHSLDSTAHTQRDILSSMARDLLPLMLDLEPENAFQATALNLLRVWDGTMHRRKPEPLIFSAWLLAFNKAVYGDELKELTGRFLGLRPRFIRSVLTEKQSWCDDLTTPEVAEDCSARLRLSLEQALRELVADYGERLESWRWSSVHIAKFRHPALSGVPVFGRYADLQIPSDGGNYTISRGASRVGDPADPFAHIHGAGLRVIYDLADLKRSRFMIATGQSGNFLSKHYDDMLEAWRDGRFRRVGMSPAALAAAFAERLTLRPQSWSGG